MDAIQAFKIGQLAGNLRHAAWTGKGSTIAGGTFSPDECEMAARLLDAAPAMLAALQSLLRLTELHIAERSATPEEEADFLACAILAEARAAIAAATGAPTDGNGAAAPTGETEYLAFCQQPDGQGTIWIDHVSGFTLGAAMQEAREACAQDWGCDPADVHCLGLIEGKATVAHWQDVCDVPAATGER